MGMELDTKLIIVVSSPMRKQCTALFTSHNTGTETFVHKTVSKVSFFWCIKN